MKLFGFGLGLAFLVLLGAQSAQATGCALEYLIIDVVFSDGIFQYNMSGTGTNCGPPELFLPKTKQHADSALNWRVTGPHTFAVGPALRPDIFIPPDQAGTLNITMSSTAATTVNWTTHGFGLYDRPCCQQSGICYQWCQDNFGCSWDFIDGTNPINDPYEFMTVEWDNTYPADDDASHHFPDMCYVDSGYALNVGYANEGYMPSPVATTATIQGEAPQGKEALQLKEKEKELAIDEEELKAIEKAVDLARLKKQHLKDVPEKK